MKPTVLCLWNPTPSGLAWRDHICGLLKHSYSPLLSLSLDWVLFNPQPLPQDSSSTLSQYSVTAAGHRVIRQDQQSQQSPRSFAVSMGTVIIHLSPWTCAKILTKGRLFVLIMGTPLPFPQLFFLSFMKKQVDIKKNNYISMGSVLMAEQKKKNVRIIHPQFGSQTLTRYREQQCFF